MGTKQPYCPQLLRDASGDGPLLHVNCLGVLVPNFKKS